MHMADALVSPGVGISMLAVSAGAIAYSVIKTKNDLDEKKVPMMGVMGAFVFAAQMINFTIPGTGSSGHIGGGILLASLLGPFPAFLTITAVLIIQALFFADGGLLALGCNIFNMGFISCFIAYPLLFKPFLKKGIHTKHIWISSLVAVVIGLQLGAFSVVLETLFSRVTELPFTSFVLLMQPIHLAIGIVEGIVTASVLSFVWKIRPEILEGTIHNKKIESLISMKKVFGILLVAALMIGGVLSWFASKNPDGLEWSMKGITGKTALETKEPIHESAKSLQEKTALMPDYSFKNKEGSNGGTSTSGIVGGVFTLTLAGGTGIIISIIKKKKKIS